jgi:hypothetical protein
MFPDVSCGWLQPLTPAVMTRSKSKLIGLLAVGCLVMSALVACMWPSSLPVHEGRPLSFWFEGLPEVYSVRSFSGYSGGLMPLSTNHPCSTREALAGMRAIGTNGLPFLFHKLERPIPYGAVDKLVYVYGPRLPLVGTLLPSGIQQEAERAKAVAGLIALCPLPPDAVQKLRTLSLEFKGPAWALAGEVLAANEDPRLVRNTLSPYE